MDPITAIGVAAAVVQFVEVGAKVAKALNEHIRAAPGDVPPALESINLQLPLILNALSRIQDASAADRLEPDNRGIVNGVVLGCYKLAREVDEILTKTRPKPGESFGRVVKKVLTTMKKESRIAEIDKGLHAYVQVLILHQVVDKKEVEPGPPPESEYFEVREKRMQGFIERKEFVDRIDAALLRVVRAQVQVPEWIFLHGPKGAGKSQLVLEYCHQVFTLGQFRTIFWLDASSPQNLRLSIEGAASTLKRSRDGSSREKLDFFKDFLAKRYQPWMLVLDSYDGTEYTNEALIPFFPAEGCGAFVVTTREYDLQGLGVAIRVYKFTTPAEHEKLIWAMTSAIDNKDIEKVVDITSNTGLNVDNHTITPWGREGLPFLNAAAKNGFDEAVQLFLDLGANRKLDNSIGSVINSAETGSTLSIILDHEDQTGERFDDDVYKRALRFAMRDGQEDIIQVLCERRVEDIDPDDNLIEAGLIDAADHGQTGILRYFAKIGKLPTKDLSRAAMMHKAIGGNRVETAKFIMSEVPYDVNTIVYGEPNIYTLMNRSDKHDGELRDTLLPLFLGAGASPDVFKPSIGKTALHLAVTYGFTAAVVAMIEHGGDVTLTEQTSAARTTTLELAAEQRHTELFPILMNAKIADPAKRARFISSALFYAASHGDRELALASMAKDPGAMDVVSEETGDTPLLAAIRHPEGLPVARLLVRKGARFDDAVVDRQGRTPLLLAAEQGKDLLVRDLATRGGRRGPAPKDKGSIAVVVAAAAAAGAAASATNNGLEAVDAKGNTPLMLAVRAGHEKTVQVLLGLGADRDAMNVFAETAEDYAEELGFDKILALLRMDGWSKVSEADC